ncbi:MAG: HAD hydrolase-like protein [Gemmobacter sp.]
MIGDTLHTDILSEQAAGLVGILVTGHDPGPFIAASRIVPEISLPSI